MVRKYSHIPGQLELDYATRPPSEEAAAMHSPAAQPAVTSSVEQVEINLEWMGQPVVRPESLEAALGYLVAANSARGFAHVLRTNGPRAAIYRGSNSAERIVNAEETAAFKHELARTAFYDALDQPVPVAPEQSKKTAYRLTDEQEAVWLAWTGFKIHHGAVGERAQQKRKLLKQAIAAEIARRDMQRMYTDD
jgi:hypothetical protein